MAVSSGGGQGAGSKQEAGEQEAGEKGAGSGFPRWQDTGFQQKTLLFLIINLTCM